MLKTLFVFACLFALVFSQCSYTDSNKCFYDLSGLTLDANSNGYPGADSNNSTFDVNVCGGLNNTDSGVIQHDQSGTDYSCGLYTAYTFADYSGAEVNATCPGINLVYAGGDACQNSDRTSTLNIGCSAEAVDAFVSEVSEDETLACVYYVQMYASAACGEIPSSSSPSPSASASMSASVSMNSPSLSASISVSTAIPSDSSSISGTPTSSLSVGASPSVTRTVSATISDSVGASSNGGIPSWVWWTLGGIVLLVIIIAIAAGGFVFYKKKQQASYDSIGYE